MLDAGRLPPCDYRLDSDDLAAFGLVPGVDGDGFFAETFDPRDDFDPAEADSWDFGWIRESTAGIELCRHPEAAVLDYPGLWNVILLWRSGALRELSKDDVEGLSNYELECVYALSAAHAREERRRMRPDGEGGEDGATS